MSGVKVSVVIPVHNTQQYLKQCLESVLTQTLDDIEIIIVNDCSPDGSADIIDSYVANDVRVTCVTHDVNKGLPAARNTGVLAAQGQYLIHLDSDDYWRDETMLQTLYQTAEIDGCDILRFNGLHDIEGEHSQLIIGPVDIINGTFADNEQFWNYRSIFLYFLRKSFLDEYDLKFMPGLNLGEDAIFISSALPHAKRISSISDPFYAYRVDNLSLMRKQWSLDNFMQEEKAARIVSKNIMCVEGAYRKYWSYRLSHYWSTKLMARTIEELDAIERKKLLEFVIETVGDLDTVDLEKNAQMSPVGKKVLSLLLAKDLASLEEYLSQLAISPPSITARKIMRYYYGVKWRVKYFSKIGYKKAIQIGGKVTGRLGIRRRIAYFRMQDRAFNNLEGRVDYNFTLIKKGKPRGASAMLRVKNEEINIINCLESIIECFDEIIVIDNGSTDGTAALVSDFKSSHPLGSRVGLHSYPFEVARCGADHQATEESSLSNLAYYYNWCMSRCQYSLICKWDADMLLSSKMENREIFKRFILSVAKSISLCTGSIPVQTVYIDDADNKFISKNEVHEEVRFFPNIPAVYFVKAWNWEVLKMTFPIRNKVLKKVVVYEMKDVKQDEFSHWSSENYTDERKIKEFRNFMHVKKRMHLHAPAKFVSTDRL